MRWETLFNFNIVTLPSPPASSATRCRLIKFVVNKNLVPIDIIIWERMWRWLRKRVTVQLKQYVRWSTEIIAFLDAAISQGSSHMK